MKKLICVGRRMDKSLGYVGCYGECRKPAEVIYQGNSLCLTRYEELSESQVGIAFEEKLKGGVFV